jgi:hypothetical protein
VVKVHIDEKHPSGAKAQFILAVFRHDFRGCGNTLFSSLVAFPVRIFSSFRPILPQLPHFVLSLEAVFPSSRYTAAPSGRGCNRNQPPHAHQIVSRHGHPIETETAFHKPLLKHARIHISNRLIFLKEGTVIVGANLHQVMSLSTKSPTIKQSPRHHKSQAILPARQQRQTPGNVPASLTPDLCNLITVPKFIFKNLAVNYVVNTRLNSTE